MAKTHIPDPLEAAVEDALVFCGVPFNRDDHDSGLDFHLPRTGIYIEVKAFHTPRIADQMSRRPNVIAVQGMQAVRALCEMIRRAPHAF